MRRSTERKLVELIFASNGQTGVDGDFSQNLGIGTPDPFRRVLVGVGANNQSRTFTSVTVGGQPTTQINFTNAAGAGFTQLGFYITNDFITAGASALIDVDISDSGNNASGVGVWSLVRPGPAAAEATNFTVGDFDPTTTSLNVSEGAAIAAMTHYWNAGTGVPTGWSGVTSDFGANVEGNSYHGGAHSNGNTAGNKSIGVTMPGTNTGPGILMACAFAPQ